MDATANPPSVYTYPEYLAFLTKILTEPAEDVHRLVLADWLEEHGERERAEFIRVQCELVRLPIGPKLCHHSDYGNPKTGRQTDLEFWHCKKGCPLCRHITLTDREQELLAFDWCPISLPRTTRRIRRSPPAVELLDGNGFRAGFEFRRGFVSSVTCTAADFLRHADALVWHPEQTVDCRACFGEGDGVDSTGCRHCGSAGSVPRPVPPTAQPIASVTLTTLGGKDISDLCALTRERKPAEWRAMADGYWSNGCLLLLGYLWPGIAFTIPAP